MEKSSDKKSVGLRIKELRKKNKEKQKDLAEIIHTTANAISKLENGEMGLTFDNMILIAEHYDVSLDYLCKGEGFSTILETLNKYVMLEYDDDKVVTDNGTAYTLPILSINRSFYDYLIQTAHAKADTNIPEELKKQWLDIETNKFNDSIKVDTYKNYATIIPVTDYIIQSNPEMFINISNSMLKDI